MVAAQPRARTGPLGRAQTKAGPCWDADGNRGESAGVVLAMKRSLLLVVLMVVVAACSGPSSSAGGGAQGLVADLQRAGAVASPHGRFAPDPLPGQGVLLCVNGELVRLYVYSSTAERAQVTARIDRN